MNNYKQTEFFDLVDTAIKMNQTHRNITAYQCVGIKSFYNEFCSVTIDVGRQSGKTSYIKSHTNINSVVIYHRKYNIENTNTPYILLHHDLKYPCHKFRGISMQHIDYVYIDEGSFLGQAERINLYEQIALCTNNKRDITFVFLG